MPGTVEFFGRPLAFSDAASLLSAHQEIFSREMFRLPAVSEPSMIIDGGANIGLATLYFKRRYPEVEVMAIEADPEIGNLLRRNIEEFCPRGVAVVEGALWNRRERVSFRPDQADGGTVSDDAGGAISVDTVLLDELIGDRPVDFLKLDIEGAELPVLEQSAASLAHVERLYIEFHCERDKPQALSRILSILEDAGFRYYLEAASVPLCHPFSDPIPDGPFETLINIFGWKAR